MKDPLIVDIEATDLFLDNLKGLFEIEILQAEKIKLPNGTTKLTLELAGEKALMFEDFIKMIVSISHKDIIPRTRRLGAADGASGVVGRSNSNPLVTPSSRLTRSVPTLLLKSSLSICVNEPVALSLGSEL